MADSVHSLLQGLLLQDFVVLLGSLVTVQTERTHEPLKGVAYAAIDIYDDVPTDQESFSMRYLLPAATNLANFLNEAAAGDKVLWMSDALRSDFTFPDFGLPVSVRIERRLTSPAGMRVTYRVNYEVAETKEASE